MRTIIIRLPGTDDFSAELAEMQLWLDDHGFSPSSFKYDLSLETPIIQVVFGSDGEAELFKRRFDGRESDFVNFERPGLPETMERACWWRLMAEEIRAEADGFASKSAQETMANVALTYERMADALERRLGNRDYRGLLVD
jgi:hypothetical protein